MCCSRLSLCRLLVLATICVLPSCSHVPRRDVAARTGDLGAAEVAVATNERASTEPLPTHASATAVTGTESETDDQPSRTWRPTVVHTSGQSRAAEPPPVPPADDVRESKAGQQKPQPAGDAESVGLTLAEIENIALQNNPTLSMAEAEIEKERGNWTQLGLYPNPTVGYLRSDPTKSGQSQTDGAFIQQTFVTGGKLRLNREIETFGIQDTGFQRSAQIQRVRNDVQVRFYHALADQERLKVAEKMVQLAEQGVRAAKELNQAKQVPLSDVLQAEIQLQAFQSALDRARAGSRSAWQQLADMAGVPQMQSKPLVGDLETDFPDFDREVLWQELLASNGLLQSIRAQVGIARKTLERQRVQPIPDITIQVVGEVDHTNNFSTISTLAPLPVFDRNQGAVYNAYHDVMRAEREIERTQLVLKDQFTVSFRDYTNARKDATRLRNEILPRAKKSLDLTTEGYQQGEFDLLRVLTARQTYFDMTSSHLDALVQARQAMIALQGLQLTGGLNPATIGAAIQGGGEGGEQRRGVLQQLQQQQGATLQLFNPGTTQ